MIPTIIIGLVFLVYVIWAFNRARKSKTLSKCSGCTAKCSQEQKEDCSSK